VFNNSTGVGAEVRATARLSPFHIRAERRKNPGKTAENLGKKLRQKIIIKIQDKENNRIL